MSASEIPLTSSREGVVTPWKVLAEAACTHVPLAAKSVECDFEQHAFASSGMRFSVCISWSRGLLVSGSREDLDTRGHSNQSDCRRPRKGYRRRPGLRQPGPVEGPRGNERSSGTGGWQVMCRFIGCLCSCGASSLVGVYPFVSPTRRAASR